MSQIEGARPQPDPAAWGQLIEDERKVELDELADRQSDWVYTPEPTRGDSPLQGVRLTGADVFYLAKRALVGFSGDPEAVDELVRHGEGELDDLHLEGAFLMSAHLEGVGLTRAHLEGARLSFAHLEGANLSQAHLQDADLFGADLAGANFAETHLQGADLRSAHLQDAYFGVAYLQGADLTWARLQGAYLSGANLEGANLTSTHLENVNLFGSRMKGANLSQCWLDSRTLLNEASLDNRTQLGDIQWGGVGMVNLTRINWESVHTLGDERGIGLRSPATKHRAVVRAYRQVAAQLRAQGMAEEADRFSYRAQVCQRDVLLRMWRLPQYVFSWLLAILAGYGYRPGRTLCWYLLLVLGYAFAYMHVGPSVGVPLSPLGALVFSVTSFHGRGFFPGGSPGHSITLDDPLTVLAASEAVVGLLIEISFIATFTQRYFGAK